MAHRGALAKFDSLVTDLRSVAVAGGGGAETLQRLHQVLQRYAPSEISGVAGLLPCASGAAALLLSWLEVLNEAVGQVRSRAPTDGEVRLTVPGYVAVAAGARSARDARRQRHRPDANPRAI